jgi:hypothetical protein
MKRFLSVIGKRPSINKTCNKCKFFNKYNGHCLNTKYVIMHDSIDDVYLSQPAYKIRTDPTKCNITANDFELAKILF